MNLQENIRRILREDKYDDKVGRIFWFEYHCYESPESCDSEIWYRSHQKVKVIGVSEWSFDDYEDRMNDGQPRVYLVEWKDGFQYDVFEDELLESPNEFYRPNPPKRKIQESIRRIIKETNTEKMIRLVGQYMNAMYPDFKEGVVDVEEYERIDGRLWMEVYRKPNSEHVYAKYYNSKKELELDLEIANSLESMFNDDMTYVVEWFNNEFGTDAEYVTYNM